MPGDNFRKRSSGDPFVMKAPLYNALIDAARQTKQNRHDAGNFQPEFRQASIVRVRNETGSDQERFAVLGISAPIILPTDNESEFANHVAFRGETPSTDDHGEGRFVILLEPLTAGSIGRAFAAGVCPVKLDVEDSEAEAHCFADIQDGQTKLAASESGPVTILWKEDGTGEVWAVIRFAPSGRAIRTFEMKETVEEKQWDFDVKGDAWFLEWDETAGDWKREGPTAEVWGDRFLHGVAFGDGDVTNAGDRVICWFEESSGKWWIIGGGQTFIVVNITEPGGIAQGSDGTGTISTGDARSIDVKVKASIMDLTEGLCYCWWDDAGGGHWDGMQSLQIGCGLKKDDEKRIAFDPAAVAGFGLVPNAGPSGDECKLDVDLTLFAGCGLLVLEPPNPPILFVNNIDLAGNGLVPGAGTCDLDVNPGCGIRVVDDQVKFEPLDVVGAGLGKVGDCGIDVLRGCGLFINQNNELEVDAAQLAGPGLTVFSQYGDCVLGVTTGCGLVFSDATNDAILEVDLRGFDGCGLNPVQMTPGNDCWGLEVDAAEIAGPGLTVFSQYGDCVLGVTTGCGLVFSDSTQDAILEVDLRGFDGCGLNAVQMPVSDCWGLEVDAAEIAGPGLTVYSQYGSCVLGVTTGCGLVLSDSTQDAILEIDLRGFDGPGLSAWQDPATECWGLQIDCQWIADNCDLGGIVPGCGLFENPQGEIEVSPSDLAGRGLVAGGVACELDVALGCGLQFDGTDQIEVDAAALAGSGLTPEGTCGLAVNPGCGLQINADAVEVNSAALAGNGLAVGAGCELLAALGCGLTFDEFFQIAVEPLDLESNDIGPTGVGCSLQTKGFTGDKQVVTAIECDPYDPYACPVAVIETWRFENGLLKEIDPVVEDPVPEPL